MNEQERRDRRFRALGLISLKEHRKALKQAHFDTLIEAAKKVCPECKAGRSFVGRFIPENYYHDVGASCVSECEAAKIWEAIYEVDQIYAKDF